MRERPRPGGDSLVEIDDPPAVLPELDRVRGGSDSSRSAATCLLAAASRLSGRDEPTLAVHEFPDGLAEAEPDAAFEGISIRSAQEVWWSARIPVRRRMRSG